MYKYKFVFFLTSLLFIFICTILVSAPAYAQGSFFDALCGAIVDNINELVIEEEVDQETRQVQTSAVKVFIRGDESDWDEFVDSTEEWAKSSLETESSKTTQPTTYRKEQKKFVKEVSRIKKDVGKTYYFEGKIGNTNFVMKVPPYKYSTYDNSSKCDVTKYADREAKIFGIYPLTQTKNFWDKVKFFLQNIFGKTKNNTQYFVILDVYDAKKKSGTMCTGDYRKAFGEFAVIVDEDTKYLDIFKDAKHLRTIGGWNNIEDNVKWNIPDVFVYDLNHDGFDEITTLTYYQGSGLMEWSISVYSTKIPLEEILDLIIVEIIREDKFYFRNIFFDGNNLYVDGKNIIDYW